MQAQLNPSERQRREQQSMAAKAGWRINEWCRAVGVSRSFTYELIAERKIKSVALGKARIITTSPIEFLSILAEQQADA
jgi:excisionase family DNA binding protein